MFFELINFWLKPKWFKHTSVIALSIVLNLICIINRDIANLNEVKIVNVNGTNILYNESKNTKTNKHVLFIHGLGSSSIVWRIFQMRWQSIFIQ